MGFRFMNVSSRRSLEPYAKQRTVQRMVTVRNPHGEPMYTEARNTSAMVAKIMPPGETMTVYPGVRNFQYMLMAHDNVFGWVNLNHVNVEGFDEHGFDMAYHAQLQEEHKQRQIEQAENVEKAKKALKEKREREKQENENAPSN